MLLWKILSGSVYNLVLATTEVIIIFQHDGQLIYKLQKDGILNVIVKVLSGSIYELFSTSSRLKNSKINRY